MMIFFYYGIRNNFQVSVVGANLNDISIEATHGHILKEDTNYIYRNTGNGKAVITIKYKGKTILERVTT